MKGKKGSVPKMSDSAKINGSVGQNRGGKMAPGTNKASGKAATKVTKVK